MKRNLSIILFAGLGFFILSSYSGEGVKYPAGSPGGYTGSPGDAKHCVQCHGGSSAPVVGWITANIPASGYVAGTTYTITVTLTGSGKKGFEVSPQTLTGALVGTLTAGSGTHLVNGNKAVTHSSSSSTTPYTKTFSWIAPAAGTGPVTFYGAFVVGKSNTKLSTTVFPESTTGISEISNVEIVVYPNPAHSSLTISGKSLNQIENLRLFSMNGQEVSIAADRSKVFSD